MRLTARLAVSRAAASSVAHGAAHPTVARFRAVFPNLGRLGLRRAAQLAAVGIPLCAISLWDRPLLARPTRAITREPAHHIVPTPGTSHRTAAPAHHLTHAYATPTRPAEKHSAPRLEPAARHTADRRDSGHGIPGRRAADTPSDPTVARVHAWQQNQRAAARAAIASADRRPTRPNTAPDQDEPSDNDSTQLTTTATLTTPELPRIRSIEEEAATPVLIPSLYDRRGHLVVPPPLYGSREVLLHQNQMADRDGLNRVRDDGDLLDLRRDRKLVPLPATDALRIDERLPANRRYSRPWTAQFLGVLARDFYASFHEAIQVNSAVRTVEFQQRLLRTNGNAAPAAGDTASPHLTGQAVDIGKHGLTMTEIAWMRAYLQPLIEQGSIDVEEEFQQACFHISVYRSYPPPPPAHINMAVRRPAIISNAAGPLE